MNEWYSLTYLMKYEPLGFVYFQDRIYFPLLLVRSSSDNGNQTEDMEVNSGWQWDDGWCFLIFESLSRSECLLEAHFKEKMQQKMQKIWGTWI